MLARLLAASTLLLAPAVAFPAVSPETRPALPEPLVLNLWPHQPPDAAPNPGPERDDPTGRVWNVSIPTMLVYLPSHTSNDPPATAIIECPGGGYTHLTRLVGADGFVHEFLPRGIAIIALKYRLKPASPDVERDALADAQRAIRLVRLHASDWHIDPHHIGVVGASAGANLVLNLLSHNSNPLPNAPDPVDRESARPDFAGLLSPWPDQHGISTYPLAPNAPPAFIASARDDRTAPCTFAQAIAAEYKAANIPHQLWLIDTGGHGAFTLGSSGEGAHWPQHFLPWLHSLHMLPTPDNQSNDMAPRSRNQRG